MKELIVIKVGTSTLLDTETKTSDTFRTVAEDIQTLSKSYDVVLVTSGAIGCGMQQLGMNERPTELDALQALSSIGQVSLMGKWHVAFGETTVGQILLTARELTQTLDVTTFKTTVQAMHQMGAVPIINENDAITNEEISFGDNDALAARVATVLGASKLVLLTDQDGVQRDFGSDTQARIPVLRIEEAIQHITEARSRLGTGGLASKLIAAGLAHGASIEVYIAAAVQPGASIQAIAGKTGTKIVQ